MDVFRVFSIALCCLFVVGSSSATPIEDIKALLKKEKESEALPPVEISKEITLVHKYNDTEGEEGSHAFSKIDSLGGLENKIQNLGGVQKTILNNKIQYNFYFWLVPKNFTGFAKGQQNP